MSLAASVSSAYFQLLGHAGALLPPRNVNDFRAVRKNLKKGSDTKLHFRMSFWRREESPDYGEWSRGMIHL